MPRGYPKAGPQVLTPEKMAAMIAGARRARALRTLEVRLWEKIERGPSDQCWPWRGAVAGNGYGQICVETWQLHDGRWKTRNGQPHRLAWESHNGRTIPEGMVIDHICRNTICCNPVHLRPVLQSDNCTTLAIGNPFGDNKKKTHCKRGHPFEGDNLRINSRGHRVCRACDPLRPSHVKRRLAKSVLQSGGEKP